MKFKYLLLFMATALITACSSDDDNTNDTEMNSIVGTWVATELKVDDATASEEVKNLRDGLSFLTAKECYVVTFTFNEDLTVVAENSVNYIEIVELDIPCPTEKDIDNSTYTYDGATLTILDSSGMEVSTNATVDGNILTVDATGLDISDYSVNGELVFKKL